MDKVECVTSKLSLDEVNQIRARVEALAAIKAEAKKDFERAKVKQREAEQAFWKADRELKAVQAYWEAMKF